MVGFLTVFKNPQDVTFSLYGSPVGNRKPLVTFAKTDVGWVVFMGRLYYSSELLSRFKLAHSPSSSDEAEMVLSLYEHVGIEGLKALEGDFSYVIFDRTRNRIFSSRDPMGGVPLFWLQLEGGTFALSNSIKLLSTLLARRKLNQTFFAQFLISLNPCEEQPSESTVYERVNRLKPGVMLEVDLKSNLTKKHSHWDWKVTAVQPSSPSLQDLALQYRSLLEQAVKERLQGRVVSELSGGMDSTSISLLSSRLREGTDPIHTISHVYERLGLLAKERRYLEDLLHSQDYVAHEIVADDLLGFDSFIHPPFHEEPFAGMWRMKLASASVEMAHQYGASTLLAGKGADELLDIQPYHIADLVKSGHLFNAWKESFKWAQTRNSRAGQIFRQFGIFPLIHRRKIAPWICSSFAKQWDLRERAQEAARVTYSSAQETALSVALSSINNFFGNARQHILASPHQMMVSHPFLDPRILRFSLGMILQSKPKPGPLKPILAEAMLGVLPENIRTRPRKGHFAEVYFLGLGRNLPMLEEMVKTASVDEFINKQALLSVLRRAALGGLAANQMHSLNVALSLVLWITNQENWYSQVCDRPLAIHQTLGTSALDASHG